MVFAALAALAAAAWLGGVFYLAWAGLESALAGLLAYTNAKTVMIGKKSVAAAS